MGSGRLMGRQPRTLLELAVANVGPMRAPRVIAFVMLWAAARETLGHEPTIDEFVQWSGMSRRTTYRRRDLYRQAYPGEHTPSRLLDVAAADWDRRRGARALGALPVQLVVA